MDICEKGCIELIAAIVKEAVRDYKKAKRKLRKNPNSKSAMVYQMTIDECSFFFQSDYFGKLTGLKGEEFMRRIDKEIDDENP